MAICGAVWLPKVPIPCDLEAGHAGEHHAKTKEWELTWKSEADLEKNKPAASESDGRGRT